MTIKKYVKFRKLALKNKKKPPVKTGGCQSKQIDETKLSKHNQK